MIQEATCRMQDELQLHTYDYSLPPERIAQHPVSPRDSSKLLFVSRKANSFQDYVFSDLPKLLNKGDLLAINNTKVIPARLECDRGEVLLVRQTTGKCWDCLVFPGKQFKPGTRLQFETGLEAEVLSHSQIGRLIQFHGDLDTFLRHYGKTPLPPYIQREADSSDKRKYQTIYARIPGSVAAPTAGLHFTRRVFGELSSRGIRIARISLHVGPGTFRPVKNANITLHRIDPEFYHCSRSTWKLIREARRVIAVGTTTTRALETIAASGETDGYTDLFLYPGCEFRIVRGLVTNFHLPKSSLLMLVSALGGGRLIRNAYQHAMNHNYRFYSYGDAMLLL